MIQAEAKPVSLDEEDETAWLDAMSELTREGRAQELDPANLAEFLADPADRDRREVESRRVVLLAHILKWTYQPSHRSRGWRGTIIEQRQELARCVGHGLLRRHAQDTVLKCYLKAVTRVSAETGIDQGAFPLECPYTLDQLLTLDLTEESA